MSVEKIILNKEFEQKIPREIERKFIPLFPEMLDAYRLESLPIEQVYLSHPSEPFSLRLRETLTSEGALCHEATIKDKGRVTEQGLERFEQSCLISESLYLYYKSAETPVIKKLRAEPLPGVVIDYYEDGQVQIESENPAAWEAFVARHGDVFVEITGDATSTNDWKAQFAFRRANAGSEALAPKESLSAATIASDILECRHSTMPIIVHIGGRSGSGKTTLVNELREKLTHSWAKLDSVVLSTDDYHRGTTWLTAHNGGEPWTKWDEPIVYDTLTMAGDIACLVKQQSIPKRAIDWSVAEPVIIGTVEPASVIIIEGIYATSPDITKPDDLQYEMTTGLATCIGRRLLRDLEARPEFADPEKSLAYMLSEAEPAYRRQLAA